jgi:LPS sulfotransferase NodH
MAKSDNFKTQSFREWASQVIGTSRGEVELAQLDCAWLHFTVHAQLSYSSRNQVGILRSKVQNKDCLEQSVELLHSERNVRSNKKRFLGCLPFYCVLCVCYY